MKKIGKLLCLLGLHRNPLHWDINNEHICQRQACSEAALREELRCRLGWHDMWRDTKYPDVARCVRVNCVQTVDLRGKNRNFG